MDLVYNVHSLITWNFATSYFAKTFQVESNIKQYIEHIDHFSDKLYVIL